jgi:hypothetical protein
MSDPIPSEFGLDARVLPDHALDTVTGGLPAIQGHVTGGVIIDGGSQALGGPDTKALGGPDTRGWPGVELLR